MTTYLEIDVTVVHDNIHSSFLIGWGIVFHRNLKIKIQFNLENLEMIKSWKNYVGCAHNSCLWYYNFYDKKVGLRADQPLQLTCNEFTIR